MSVAKMSLHAESQTRAGKSRYLYGLTALFLGCFGGSTAYLGRRPVLTFILAFLVPAYFIFIPFEYLRWLLLVLFAVNIIRAALAGMGVGYVASHEGEFISPGDENATLRGCLIACTAVAAVTWMVAAAQLVQSIV